MYTIHKYLYLYIRMKNVKVLILVKKKSFLFRNILGIWNIYFKFINEYNYDHACQFLE